MEEFMLERKMALDAIQDRGLMTLDALQDERQMAMDAAEVERDIAEIKRCEAAASGGAVVSANVPLEKLLTSLGGGGGGGAAGGVSPLEASDLKAEEVMEAADDEGGGVDDAD